jgi:hypothetical protein
MEEEIFVGILTLTNRLGCPFFVEFKQFKDHSTVTLEETWSWYKSIGFQVHGYGWCGFSLGTGRAFNAMVCFISCQPKENPFSEDK